MREIHQVQDCFSCLSGAGFLPPVSVAKVGVPIVAEVTGPMAGKCGIPVMGGHLIAMLVSSDLSNQNHKDRIDLLDHESRISVGREPSVKTQFAKWNCFGVNLDVEAFPF